MSLARTLSAVLVLTALTGCGTATSPYAPPPEGTSAQAVPADTSVAKALKALLESNRSSAARLGWEVTAPIALAAIDLQAMPVSHHYTFTVDRIALNGEAHRLSGQYAHKRGEITEASLRFQPLSPAAAIARLLFPGALSRLDVSPGPAAGSFTFTCEQASREVLSKLETRVIVYAIAGTYDQNANTLTITARRKLSEHKEATSLRRARTALTASRALTNF